MVCCYVSTLSNSDHCGTGGGRFSLRDAQQLAWCWTLSAILHALQKKWEILTYSLTCFSLCMNSLFPSAELESKVENASS